MLTVLSKTVMDVQVTLQHLAKLNRERPTIAILPSGIYVTSALLLQKRPRFAGHSCKQVPCKVRFGGLYMVSIGVNAQDTAHTLPHRQQQQPVLLPPWQQIDPC